MKYYLSVDSGGTKTQAILYNEDFCMLGEFRTGSFRENTTSAALAQKNADSVVEWLEGAGVDKLSLLTGYGHEILTRAIATRYPEVRVKLYGELDLGLACAGISGPGLLVLSGTGCVLFSRYLDERYGSGGYGAPVSDEGSGYDIGRRAFAAVIADYEGRGEKTVLSKMLCEKLGHSDTRDAIFSVYDPARAVSPSATVASFSESVSHAADAGDAVALRILTEVGRSVGEQTAAHIRMFDLPQAIPVTVSGSVWQGNGCFARAFLDTVREYYPDFKVTPPRFAPVVGGILLHGKEAEDGVCPTWEFFEKVYEKYLLTPPEGLAR